MIRTGIFGGSFNPIHNGHLSLARQLKERARLDEVWLMVSPQNPLKRESDLLDDRLRLEMVREALKDEPGITASDYELHLPKPSYTWNTLQALSHDYPDREFVLLIGGDNRALFDKWYHADDILRNYEVVAYPRRGEGTGETTTDGIRLIDAELIDLSSTEIRQRVQEGRSIRSLVPERVAQLIETNGYYA